jgi:ATP-dependent Clp protease ATP-binding subunit ClpX
MIGFMPEDASPAGPTIKLKTGQRDSKLLRQVEVDDLVQFGMIPELLGRLPVTTVLDPLSEADLVRVLTEPRNALIKQYQKYFELEGSTLSFEPKALLEVVKKAMAKSTGVRALRSILEDLLLDTLYALPSNPGNKNYVITEAMVLKETPIEPVAATAGAAKSPRAASKKKRTG